VAVLNKDLLADMLEDFDDSGYAELYRKVLHPMVVVPPMVLLDAFEDIMRLLSRRGFVCPTERNGELPLEIEASAAGVIRARLQATQVAPTDCASDEQGRSVKDDASAGCWRILAQRSAVTEARRSLNLFQLRRSENESEDSSPGPLVPTSVALAMLMDAWNTAATAWTTMSTTEAFSELYLAARFLLLAGHEPLPSDSGFFLGWDQKPWDNDESSRVGGHCECILLRVPQHTATANPWWQGANDSTVVPPTRWAPNAFNSKRLRVDRPC